MSVVGFFGTGGEYVGMAERSKCHDFMHTVTQVGTAVMYQTRGVWAMENTE